MSTISTPHLINALSFIGKLLLVALFWWDVAFQFIPNFTNLINYIAQHGLPFPSLVAQLTTLFLIICPALIFFKFSELIGYFGLAMFCIATALVFHQFWTLSGNDRVGEQLHFMKDLALAGTLIIIVARHLEFKFINRRSR